MSGEHEHVEDDDFLEGCDIDFSEDPTSDDDLDAVVLFADVDPSDTAAIEARKAEWQELFGAA